MEGFFMLVKPGETSPVYHLVINLKALKTNL